MAVEIQKLFNEELPGKLAKNREGAKQLGAKYQFNVTGDDGGEWFIDLTSSGPSVTKGKGEGANCTITVSSSDFQKLYENPQANGMQLFFSGKLKVEGDPMLATKLQKLFAL
jgi:putative sterol carrier protein